MAQIEAADSERKTLAEHALSLLTEVRAGEGPGVLLLALNIFLLLAGYYLLKTVREALILTEGGAEIKTYSSAGQAVLLLAIVPAYGALASRVNRLRLITWVTLVFAANLVLFYLFGVAGAREGIVFFLWVGIFNVFIVAQFWAFANDLYSESSGRRLFPAIALGGSLGALAGSRAAAMWIGAAGPYGLMLISALVLLVCIAISWVINRRAAADAAHFTSGAADAPLSKTGAWELLFEDRYLLLIAILTVLLNVVNTCGEFLLSKFVVAEAARVAGANIAAQQRFVGEFYGNFLSWVNAAGLVLQMFAVSRIFRYVGVRGALFMLPCVAFLSYSSLLLVPLLPVVRLAKILENSTDYSVEKTTAQALFLVTSREAKYKAKAAVDTFCMRSGDVLAAGIVYAGSALAFGVKGFAITNLVLTLVWLAAAAGIAREHRRRTGEERPVIPSEALAATGDAAS